MTAQGPKTVWQTEVTEYATTDKEGIGSIRQEGKNFYRWVYNNEATAMELGAGVCYEVGDGANFHEKVHKPTTAALNDFAGVCMSAIPATSYGWILMEGVTASCQVLVTDTSMAAGFDLRPANGVYYINSAAQHSLTVNSVSNQMCGRARLLVSVATSSASATSLATASIHCLTV